jgi:nuclear RNA export factor
MSLENLAKLAESLPNITRLNLKNNTVSMMVKHTVYLANCYCVVLIHVLSNCVQLKSTDDLNHLQPLKLEELWLEGNPLCDRFNTAIA